MRVGVDHRKRHGDTLRRKLFCGGFPMRREVFAVAAPRRVEFHGEVFGFADLAAQIVERCELYS